MLLESKIVDCGIYKKANKIDIIKIALHTVSTYFTGGPRLLPLDTLKFSEWEIDSSEKLIA